MNFKSSLVAALSVAALGMGVANANTLALPGVPNAQTAVPGSFSSVVYANAVDAAAKLDFVLQGYKTLDGSSDSANWDDKFTLFVNDVVVGSGFFKLGGGGDSSWAGTGTWTCTTCAVAQTNTGGTASFDDVIVGLNVGANTIKFQYTAPEGGDSQYAPLFNEGWRIAEASIQSTATVSAVPEAETYAMMLAGLGLMGSIVRRRKAKAA